jgi:hypothetical protein
MKVSIGPALPMNLDLYLDALGLVLDLGDAVHVNEKCAEHEVVRRVIWPLECDVLISLGQHQVSETDCAEFERGALEGA